MTYIVGIAAYAAMFAVLLSISHAKGGVYAAVPGDNWSSRLQRTLSFPLGWYYPLIAVQGPYKRQIDGKWRPGRLWLGWACVDEGEHEDKLFRNGVVFARVAFPFCVCASIRWAGADLVAKSHWDFVLGWRTNGVPGASCRIQSDASSAAGFDLANPGQAQGFEDGWR